MRSSRLDTDVTTTFPSSSKLKSASARSPAAAGKHDEKTETTSAWRSELLLRLPTSPDVLIRGLPSERKKAPQQKTCGGGIYLGRVSSINFAARGCWSRSRHAAISSSY